MIYITWEQFPLEMFVSLLSNVIWSFGLHSPWWFKNFLFCCTVKLPAEGQGGQKPHQEQFASLFLHNPKVGGAGLENCPCLNQGNTLFIFVIRQKEQMKKLNKSKCVDERLLFHGTNPSLLPAICEQNFDWRICGVNGTVYGKGTRAWAGPALKLSGCF